jgi:phosphoserine aminotransferase
MAADEARRMAEIDVFWTGEARGFCDLPAPEAMPRDGDWSYVYFASNETIHGVQFRPLPTGWSSPLVCDMSSDFLSRPISVRDYAMLFACAQKNAGIAGLTIVIVDRNRLREVAAATPGYLNLKSHIRDESLYNTPPTFAIYVLKLMLEWIRTEFGDLPTLEKENLAKAALVYGAIDQFPQVYRGHAHRNARSAANVSFYLPNEDDLARFLAGAAQNGMTDLRGHRTLGGVRVSLYNAIRKSTVQRLVQYMEDFARG